jgi:predicted HTH domain antitoxin
MALIVSDHFLNKLEISADELLVDLACFLYEKRRMSFGKAKALSGLNRVAFQKALGDRHIYMNYDEEELNTDLENLNIQL